MDNDNDVSADFLHNVQTAVDSTGVGGRVGVIDTDQGPLTVIFMDEGEDAANMVSNSGDTNIQFVVDNADPSAVQYIQNSEAQIQFVSDTSNNDSSNIEYIQDQTGQIQYVTDTTAPTEQQTNENSTVENGAGDMITYLVDEAGNVLQYITGDASDVINHTSQFDGDCNPVTDTTNIPTQALETPISTVPQSTTRPQTSKTTQDNVVEVEPVINILPSALQSDTKQESPQTVALVKPHDTSLQSTSKEYKPQQLYPKRQIRPNIPKMQSTSKTGRTSTPILSTSVSTKQAMLILENNETGKKPLKQTISLLPSKLKHAEPMQTIITIGPSVSKTMPVTKKTPNVAMALPKSKVTKTNSERPELEKTRSSTQTDINVNVSEVDVKKTMQQLIKVHPKVQTPLPITNASLNKKNIQLGTLKQQKITTPLSMPDSGELQVLTKPLSSENTSKCVGVAATTCDATDMCSDASAIASAIAIEQDVGTGITATGETVVQVEAGEAANQCVSTAGTGSEDSQLLPGSVTVMKAATTRGTVLQAVLPDNMDMDLHVDPHVAPSVEAGQLDSTCKPSSALITRQFDVIADDAEPADSKDTTIPQGMEEFAPLQEIPFKCRECNMEFGTEKQLKRHILNLYIDNVFCKICNENLKSKFRLQRHIMDKHSVGMPYKCPKCSLAFNTGASYWRHAQIHARLITCTICDKAFNQNGDLKRHIFTVHGICSPHICAFCGKSFLDRELYKKHRLDVHGLSTRDYKSRHRDVPQVEAVAERAKNPENAKKKLTTGSEIMKHRGQRTEVTEAVKMVMDSENSPPNEMCETLVIAQQSQHIQLPANVGDKGEVTIQLYGDGTMMTTDGSNVDYGSVDLSSLGINPDMLKDNANIELIIVEGDGDKIKEQLESDPSKLINVLENNSAQTVTVKKTPVRFKAGKFKGTKFLNYKKYMASSTRIFHCRYCPRTFHYYRHLRCHEIAHTSKKSIVCPLCQRCFVREANLASHLELHKTKTILPDTPKLKRNRRSAEEIANDLGEHMCEICNKSYTKSSRLKRHIDDVHLNKSMRPCPICGLKLKSESSVQRHLKIHIGPFNCYDCNAQFTSKDEYLNHQANVHPLKHFVCKFCNKQFTTRKFLWNHMRKLHVSSEDTIISEDFKDLRPHECQVCKKSFGRKSTLNKHMIVHTGIRKFKCDQCDHRFAYNWKCKQHIENVHLNQRNFKCHDCECAFKTSSSVKHHRSIWHSGPYSCSECSESFDHKQELLDHRFDIHHLSNNKCSVCKMVFKSKNLLSDHNKEVHDKFSNLCDLCGKHKTKLKAHLVSEHFNGDEEKMLLSYPNMKRRTKNERSTALKLPYCCDFCEKSFSYKVRLKAHLKCAHFGGDEKGLNEKYPSLLKVPNPPEPLICNFCGKRFARSMSLNLHMRVHGVVVPKKKVNKDENLSSDDEPDIKNILPRETKSGYSCDICGREFSRLASLKKHVTIHVETNETEMAMKEIEIEEHERAEEEEQMERQGTLVIKGATKEYHCHSCKKVFKRKNDLDNHHICEHEHLDGIDVNKPTIGCKSNPACDICGKSFTKNINLRRHTILKHGIKMEAPQDKGEQSDVVEVTEFKSSRKCYNCKFCEEIFQQIQQLEKHIAIRHKSSDQDMNVSAANKGTLTCTHCGKIFSRKEKFKIHMSSCSSKTYEVNRQSDTRENSTNISQFLGMNFSLEAKREAKPYEVESVKSKKHKCKQCGEAFSREATLKKHALLHNESSEEENSDVEYSVLDINEHIFTCSECGSMYASSKGLIQHIRGMHSDIDEAVVKAKIDQVLEEEKKHFNKNVVSKDVIPPKNNESDLAKEKYEQTYVCTYCGNIYASALGRGKHIEVMHPGKGINCDVSHPSTAMMAPKPKETSVSTSGRIITKEGVENNALQCDICDKLFSEDINRRRHMTMKHGVKRNYVPDQKSQQPRKKAKITDDGSNFEEYSCDKCSKSFLAFINLRRHMIMKHKIKVSCEALVGQKQLKNVGNGPTKKSKVTSHLTVDEDGKADVYECNMCSKLYTDFTNLRRHMKMKHDLENTDNLLELHPDIVKRMPIHTCKVCLKKFPKLYALKCHMKMKHNQKYKSRERNDNTNDVQINGDESNVAKAKQEIPEQADRHGEFISQAIRSHTENTQCCCCLCDRHFRSMFMLECHYNSQHSDKFNTMIKCEKCLNLFENAETLLEHQIKHKESNLLECQLCKITFTEKNKYEEHVKLHINRPYKCKQCDKAFRWKRNLISHVSLFHNSINMKKCGVCYKSFPDKDRLNRHMSIHKVKTFSCPKCRKMFLTETLLQSHIRIAHKKRSLCMLDTKLKSKFKIAKKQLMTCNICNKGYHTQERLMDHMLSHTSLKPFRCNQIPANNQNSPAYGKAHKTSEKKMNSLKKVSPNSERKSKALKTLGCNSSSPSTSTKNHCEICNVIFTRSYNLRRHMKNAHGLCKITNIEKSGEVTNVDNVCPVCKTKFTKPCNLKKHILNVHGNKLGELPSTDQIHTSGSLKNFFCYYCSDCSKVYWSPKSYTDHIKEVHAGRSTFESDELVESRLTETTEIKNEVVEPAISELEQQCKKKRVLNSGPVRHKCELCGRVHWTEKSFESHMLKFHRVEEADNPVIEIVYDNESDHSVTECNIQNVPVNYKQLTASPIVKLQRITNLVVENSTTVESIAHDGVKMVDSASIEDIAADVNYVVSMDSELQDIENVSVMMQDNTDAKLGISENNKILIDIDPGTQHMSNIGIIVDKENLVSEQDIESPPHLVPTSMESIIGPSLHQQTVDETTGTNSASHANVNNDDHIFSPSPTANGDENNKLANEHVSKSLDTCLNEIE